MCHLADSLALPDGVCAWDAGAQTQGFAHATPLTAELIFYNFINSLELYNGFFVALKRSRHLTKEP